MFKILLIDDSAGSSDIPIVLMQTGNVVAVASGHRDALNKLEEMDFDWTVCFRREVSGQVDAFLAALGDASREVPCSLLVVGSEPAPDLSGLPVVRAVHAPPPDDPTRLLELLEEPMARVTESAADQVSERMAESPCSKEVAPGVQPFIGSSPSIKRIIRTVEKIAVTDSTVLVLGESGTGKELVAQSVHYLSKRADQPLVPVNCGAIPADLLESELFGHAKGAFSGAIASRPGRFELAHGGTLFLDEVGELSGPLQVKLLRALQEGEIAPLGASKTFRVDVRIVAATNQNLEDLVEKRLFREDLYYRLNVIPILMPRLQERREDIVQLIRYFISVYNDKCGTELEGFTSDALDALVNYSWPGNIRELKNFVERVAILSDTTVVALRDLPEKIQRCKAQASRPIPVTLPEQGLDFYDAVDQFEKALILQALDRTGWNKNRAASLLTMNRTTLVEKIKKKAIERPDRGARSS